MCQNMSFSRILQNLTVTDGCRRSMRTLINEVEWVFEDYWFTSVFQPARLAEVMVKIVKFGVRYGIDMLKATGFKHDASLYWASNSYDGYAYWFDKFARQGLDASFMLYLHMIPTNENRIRQELAKDNHPTIIGLLRFLCLHMITIVMVENRSATFMSFVVDITLPPSYQVAYKCHLWPDRYLEIVDDSDSD